MPRPFKESLQSIVETWKHVRMAGATKGRAYDRIVTHHLAPDPEAIGDQALQRALPRADDDYHLSEADLMEQTMDNVAKVLASWQKYLDTVEKLVALGIEDIPPDLRREAESVRRTAALSERGRTPIEVAALYGYARSSSVIRLRERHGQDPKTGYPLPKPLTAPARDQLATVEGEG